METAQDVMNSKDPDRLAYLCSLLAYIIFEYELNKQTAKAISACTFAWSDPRLCPLTES